MADYVFDVAAFRVAFPLFCDATAFPDSVLQGYWDAAACIISDANYGRLSGGCRARALNLMAAHLAALQVAIAEGNAPAQITSATIEKITVSLNPPPTKDGFDYWLSLTPYGMQLWALLKAKSSGGFYVGGIAERSGFRRAFGGFNG